MEKRILIVDDNQEALEILETILQKEGYQTHTASTGAACIDSLKSFQPDMILLDVILPDTLGTELCQKIKNDPQYEDIIVILISGVKVSADDRIFGIEIGASEYFKRPYEKRELIAKINSLFQLKTTLVSKRQNEPYGEFSRSNTSLTAKIFEQESIDKAYPEQFEAFSDAYYEILIQLIEERIYKTAVSTPEKVKQMATELSFLKAGAVDVVNIHKEALKKLVDKSSAIKTYYIKEESRILLVELMGYLLNNYRNLS